MEVSLGEVGTKSQQGCHKQIKAYSVEDIDLAYLSGVFDSAGTLSMKIGRDEDYRINYNMRLICRITIPGGEENPLMGKFIAYCEENVVRYSTATDGNSVRIIIERPEDVRRFLEPMLPYLITQYERALMMLEEIVPRIKDELHRDKDGFIEIMEYADMLRSSARQQNRKYDKEFFEKEWSVTE